MTFEVGQTVVYPHHGAAIIQSISQRTLKGEPKTYLTLQVTNGDLTIQVPADNVEMVGVRDVVDEAGLQRVLSVLQTTCEEEPTNWSRRFKANLEKIATGDILKVSEVVRDLSHRETDRGLSAGEKRMLAKARQILVSELALAKGEDEEQASQRLDNILAQAYSSTQDAGEASAGGGKETPGGDEEQAQQAATAQSSGKKAAAKKSTAATKKAAAKKSTAATKKAASGAAKKASASRRPAAKKASKATAKKAPGSTKKAPTKRPAAKKSAQE